MSKYIEPSQTSFDDAEQAALDILDTKYPQLVTKVGSAIRELLVRPMAYLVSWASDNLIELRKKSSIRYLKTSAATDNEIADDIASNYFISRKRGVRARGVVTLTVSDKFFSLPSGSRFSVENTQLETPNRVIAMPGETAPGLRDGVMHVNMTRTGERTWVASIPVQAVEAGPIEISGGADVVPQFGMAILVSAVLTSAITGGAGAETDAQMMQRAEAATASSGIGSYFGIRNKLDAGPVHVLSMALAAGEDSLLMRARHNTVNINPGGFVDCYVKTQNQLASAMVTATPKVVSTGGWNRRADLPVVSGTGVLCHGALCVDGPLLLANGTTINSYDVAYAAVDNTGDGARLGVGQSMSVYFHDDGAVSDVTATVLYMPGLYDLQRYMDSDANRFVGQNICMKSAVQVSVSVACVAACPGTLSVDQLDKLRQAIADYVNGTAVGAGTLNFSDIREHCVGVVAGVELRLPCSISASTRLSDGGTDSFFTNTGVLDIRSPVNTAWWNPEICYFSTTKANIRIEQE